MALRQREISVSEFFAKNRHLLGFDNPSKALLTTVKELVDNALDAADEARIPADVEVQVDQLAEDRFRVICTDNGPGIVAKHVPLIFGKLLYGSKFHRLKMSRGQQGIGVSAAGMYGLLTTGKPVVVITRIGPDRKATLFHIAIDTKKNQPTVRDKQEVDWDLPHGTQVEIELEASYRKGQHSIDAYVHQICLANPHTTMRYLAPGRSSDNDVIVHERVTEELPPETAEIRPHPYGVELGVLLRMLHDSSSRTVASFLSGEFSRLSSRVAQSICRAANIGPNRKPRSLDRADAEALHRTIAATKLMAPPTDCIAPIGQELLEEALQTIQPTDFCTAVTRRPTVYRGNPFLIEAAVAWGGNLPGDEPITLYRFANRVPLQYQQGGCAITRAVTTADWKKYGLQQPRGALPIGPAVVLVHVASVWVPFTSESKEAIAHYPEILREIKLALQDCGRRMSAYINRKRRLNDEEKKRSFIQKYIPQVAIALQQILDLSDKDRDRTVEKLTTVLERSRKM
jgi:DNA topoisomerase-6 subunit B